jgi:hypothetical protein
LPVLGADVPPAPTPPRASKRPPYDPPRLADFAARCPVAVTLEWLAERSPVPVVCVTENATATAISNATTNPAGNGSSGSIPMRPRHRS